MPDVADFSVHIESVFPSALKEDDVETYRAMHIIFLLSQKCNLVYQLHER
jgi:hypothetical protein